MRRAVAPLLLALAIVSPLLAQSAATSGATTRYSRLYVFGDSYSDIGAGYIDGNGPTAVAYLGWLMGLQIASSKAVNSADKSLVFAVIGQAKAAGLISPEAESRLLSVLLQAWAVRSSLDVVQRPHTNHVPSASRAS